jgi:Transcriptional regulator
MEETSRRLRKKNNTHKALLHSAKKLLEEKGIGNVTIDDISEAADVSRSTFFTHFSSLDVLLEEIANEEISDLAAVWQNSDVAFSVTALLNKLVEDTIPYPYLTGELLMRGILSKGESSFNSIYKLTEERIATHHSYEKALEYFTAEELSALLLGSYFGFVFQRFIKNKPFDDDVELKKSIEKFINFLKK